MSQAVLGVRAGLRSRGRGVRAIWRNVWRCSLKAKDRLDPAMAALLTRLDLVARRDIGSSPALCGVDAEDIADMIAEIRAAQSQAGPGVRRRAGDAGGARCLCAGGPRRRLAGGIELRHPAAASGQLALLRASVARRRATRIRKTYLTDCLNNANWLVKSLDQRARTILKVASEIVRQQDALPHSWRAPSAAAQSANHRRRDLDA